MTETTQEERDELRDDPHPQPEDVRRVCNDADRLAELEQGVRELSALWESQQAEYPNTDTGRVSAAAVLCCAAELSALLKAPRPASS